MFRAPAIFAVRVRSGAARTQVGGCYPGPHGPALIVAVPAPAVDGRATQAALQAVADALGVRRATLQLRTGARSRDKLVQLADPPDDLPARLAALLDAPSQGTA